MGETCSVPKKDDRCIRSLSWENWSERKPGGGLDVDGHNITACRIETSGC